MFAKVISQCFYVADILNDGIKDWAEKNAVIKNLTDKMISLGKNSHSEKLGEIGANAGDLTREAINTIVSSFKMALELRNNPKSKTLKDVYRKADLLPFNALLPNGKNVELSKLESTDEDTFVEVKGFVKEIEVYRSGTDGKLVTKVIIHDPSSKKDVYLAGVFVHLEHIGLTVGSYCVAHGKLSHSSILTNGHRTVQINLLRISTEIAETSWRYSFLNLSKDLYEWLKNGMQISIAHSLHLASDKFSKGASELMYPPFLFSNDDLAVIEEQQKIFNSFRDIVERKMRSTIFSLDASSFYLTDIANQKSDAKRKQKLEKATLQLFIAMGCAKSSIANIARLDEQFSNQ